MNLFPLVANLTIKAYFSVAMMYSLLILGYSVLNFASPQSIASLFLTLCLYELKLFIDQSFVFQVSKMCLCTSCPKFNLHLPLHCRKNRIGQ